MRNLWKELAPALLFMFLALGVLSIAGGWCAACTTQLEDHVRARYPDCQVEVVNETGDTLEVLLHCPGSNPTRRTFTRQ